jgi:hypothetical protein
LSATGHDLQARLWRARRQHDHLDARLELRDGQWVLEYVHNDRSMLEWRFATREEAAAEADRRLRELQRAGWNVHW